MLKNSLFNIIPNNFFNIFSTSQKEIYVDSLFLLFHHLDNGNNYGEKKEKIINLLSTYVSKKKTLSILRRLKICGWIYEEEIANYDVIINFTYYSIPILKTLNDLKKKNKLEYMGYLFAIYSMIKNIEYASLGDILDQIYNNTMIIMNRLKTLNANIKKYIQELIEKDNLQTIVDNLFSDYKINIVDEYYQRLKTSDNLSKYRPFIISKLNEISINSKIINDAGTKLVDKQTFNDITEAKTHLYQQINYIISSLSNIEIIIKEIDSKNSYYIKTAITKILYIVSNPDKTTGKINKIIDYLVKNKNDKKITHNLFHFYSAPFFSRKSLYTMPKKTMQEEQTIKSEKSLDDSVKLQFLQKVLERNRFSKQKIINYVKEALNASKEMLASQLPLNNYDDYIKLILIYMYSKNNYYLIERRNSLYKEKGICFNDFVIRRTN